MKKETVSVNGWIRGRSKVMADFAMVLSIRGTDHWGWSGMAEGYRGLNGQFVIRDTIE